MSNMRIPKQNLPHTCLECIEQSAILPPPSRYLVPVCYQNKIELLVQIILKLNLAYQIDIT